MPDAETKNVPAVKRAGYKGQFEIHPAQIEIIMDVFTPIVAKVV